MNGRKAKGIDNIRKAGIGRKSGFFKTISYQEDNYIQFDNLIVFHTNTVKAQKRGNYPKLKTSIAMFKECLLEETMPALKYIGDVGLMQG